MCACDEGCLSGHFWRGGACARCGERLACGACHQYVTIENLSNHIDNECRVKWEASEDTRAPEAR